MNLINKTNFNEIIKRRKRFHNLEMKREILFSVESMIEYPYINRPKKLADLIKLPSTGEEMKLPSAQLMANRYTELFSQFSDVEDDRLPLCELMNTLGHAVFCEILGLPVRRICMGVTCGSVLQKKLSSIDEALELVFNEESESVNFVFQYLKDAVSTSQGKWLLSPYVLADGIHVLTQLFGYSELYLLLHDQPDKVHLFCKKYMEINKKFFERQYEIAGPIADGWAIARSDWNPERCICFNLDDYLMCSNDVFLEFGLPYIQNIIDHFGCGVIHYHTPDTRLLKSVVKLKNIKIQIGEDLNLPYPIDTINKIKEVVNDIPLTWIRVERDSFLKKLKAKELPGNVEYLLNGVKDKADANRLSNMAKEYISPM